jgi:DNA replication and repair protein RecF
MAIEKLDIFALRNIQSLSIQPSSGINLIYGLNASGKTALLESLFLLSRTKSFRTTHLKQLISFDAKASVVSAQNRFSNGSISTLGIKVENGGLDIRINQENSSRTDLAYALPLQLIHPKSSMLLDGGPLYRREFTDWALFNTHLVFLSHWRAYQKVLQQRNFLLKSTNLHTLHAFDRILSEHGEAISHFRAEYLKIFTPIFLQLASVFLGVSDFSLKYSKGWSNDFDLFSVLASDHEKDIRYGYTQSGPHRADIHILYQGRPVKDFLSRGQQKLLTLALYLSQVQLLNTKVSTQCILLIDDLGAELDSVNKAKLIEYLDSLGCQVFITATHSTEFGDLSRISNLKMFHVKHGAVEAI